MMGPKTAPGGRLPPASWRSFCGCGKLIFSNSGVFMGLRETYFFVFRVFLGFWPGVIVSQEVAQRMGGEAIHELGPRLDQMFLGLETLFLM